ncbi:hypothetical protein DDZ18_10520 [Marinicauda salina]|uniref:Uncharacterized protein n=1 Tax=Marinicauda salina TaxID=2135793 RepID=A0A2U2BSZ4_9PROT|nr:hypothetical protein [Marinicauda salina]PWE17124.1 hypothetical protein DDZ18_10520 [Marinicauda salina]
MASRDARRAGEWRFGDEISPPEDADGEERELWERAGAGDLHHPRRILALILEEIEASDWGEPAKASMREEVSGILELLDRLPEPPPGVAWEECRAGRAYLLAYRFFSLGREYAAAHGEFGENGARIYREKHSEPLRRYGAEARKAAARLRNVEVEDFIDRQIGAGELYKNAVRDAAAKFNLSEKRVRSIAPKKDFSDHSR